MVNCINQVSIFEFELFIIMTEDHLSSELVKILNSYGLKQFSWT